MPDKPERLFFAYGSNINLDQMERRCPNAEVVAPVTLNGYRLAFRGHTPGCGVATILSSPIHQVKGLLWKLTPDCERSLDCYEGFPSFYGKEDITVMDRSGKQFTVMAYVMTPEYAQMVAMPSASYAMGIAEGYGQNRIPTKGLEEAITCCRHELETQEAAYWQTLKQNERPKKSNQHKGYER